MAMAEEIIERFISADTCFLLIILRGGLFYFYFLILVRWVFSKRNRRQRGAVYCSVWVEEYIGTRNSLLKRRYAMV
jgi:hypothetical protein